MQNTGTSLLPKEWLIHLPVFEGPLDLLLQLVKVNEVEITDIPVALVCDQFQEYITLMEEMDLDVAAEYIYEAALLIHVKSKLLLPRPKTVEGEVIEEDPRDDLVARLLEYRKLKEVAQTLAEVDSVRSGIWARSRRVLPDLRDGEAEEEVELGDLSLFDLLSTLRTVLDRYDRENPPPMRLPGESYSVRDQFKGLLAKLVGGATVDLLEDLAARGSRGELVAAFLAVLELARLRLVRFHRTDAGDIFVHRTDRELGVGELEAIQG